MTLERWSLERRSPDAPVLDRCAYRLEGSTWAVPAQVLGVAEQLAACGARTPFRLRFEVRVDDPLGALALVSEPMPGALLMVNGTPLGAAQGWWLDRAFRRFDVVPLMKPGANRTEVSGDFDPACPPEAFYLIGDFGASVHDGDEEAVQVGERFLRWRVEPRLRADTSSSFRPGDDLVAQGCPHFCSELRCQTEFFLPTVSPQTQATLVFLEVRAATLVVEVNGAPCEQAGWARSRVDISGAVQRGLNWVSLTPGTTLHNLLGPFHTARLVPPGFGRVTLETADRREA